MAKIPTSNTSAVQGKLVSIRGEIVGSGVAEMVRDIAPGQGRQIRSSKLTQFSNGDNVEAKLRIRGDGTYTLLSVAKLDLQATYQLFATGGLVPASDRAKLVRLIWEHFAWDPAKVEEILAAGEKDEMYDIPISPALHYDDAYNLLEVFGNELEETVILVQRSIRGAPKPGVAGDPFGIADAVRPKLVAAPAKVGNHYLSQEERELFGAIANRMTAGRWSNIRLTGESGYGKTAKVRALADFLKVPIEILDCSTVLDTESWYGYQEARDGSTVFMHTRFTDLLRKGNCVILLDEANRVEPQLSNSLFPILDDRRRTVVHNEEIVVGPAVVIAMTVNTGIKYAGINVQDQALLNRTHGTFEVGPLPQRVERELLTELWPTVTEDEIMRIVATATSLRETVRMHRIDVDVSTRTSLKVAEWLADGASMDQAWKWSLLNIAAPEERKPLVDAINVTDSRGMSVGWK